MLYSLHAKINTYDLINFNYKSSSDHMAFQDGHPLRSEDVFLTYEVASPRALEKIKKLHFIGTIGPSLVSVALRECLKEDELNAEVQFFDVNIFCAGEQVNGFYVINPLNKLESVDLSKSEYSLANFDPRNPCYDFDYRCLRDEFGVDAYGIQYNVNIATCAETPSLTIVNDKILERLKSKKIKGLRLSSASDITPKDRSVYINL